MSPPTPPSPPIISRPSRDEDTGYRTTNIRTSYHRTARDYRASRSRSRGRGHKSRTPDRTRIRQRTHSRSRSRDANRYRSNRRYRPERSRSRGRTERLHRTSHRSRSRSYSRSHKSSHRSRSRSGSRLRRRQNRSRSSSKTKQSPQRRSNRREERSGNTKQANVIVVSSETYKDSLKSSSKMPSVKEEPSGTSSSSSSSAISKPTTPSEPTPSWKTIKADQVGVYSNLEPDAPIDKEKIHKEIEEKLRLVLAREGKVYPYPKPEPSHPVFANDGSFLEIFKKMQQQQTFVQQQVGESMQIHAVPATPVAPSMPITPVQHPPPPQLPIFGRRRGGKILKTGVVAKPTSQNDSESGDVKDFWSIYLREVKKYKSTACESDSKTRPLVR